MIDYGENLRGRLTLIAKCEESDEVKAMVMEQCRRDIIFWIENFAFTDKNSNFFWENIPSKVPFLLFPFQKEFVLDLWDAILEGTRPISERKGLTNVFIEKSRQMGLSWLIILVYVYGFLFHNHKYLTISQKEKDVDSRWDIKSHFEKMRFIISALPQWMLPPWFDKNTGTEFNKTMNISRKDSTGSITGESANPNASRGGTYHSIFLDEMASMANASAINTAAARATPCRIFNSTPAGMGNEYYRMRQLAETGSFRYHRIHWSEHPYYTNEWYEKEKLNMRPEQVAQELDINYNLSLAGRVYTEFTGKQDTSIVYNPKLPVYVAIDNSHGGVLRDKKGQNVSDPHAIIVAQTDGHYWNIVDYLEIHCSVTDVAMMMGRQPKMDLPPAAREFYNRYVEMGQAIFVADPHDTHSTLNESTIYDEYAKMGIYLNTNIPKTIAERVMRTRANVYRLKFGKHTVDLINAFMNARYPERRESSQSTQDQPKPIHDWTSHGRSALEYLVNFLLECEKYTKKREPIRMEVGNPIT